MRSPVRWSQVAKKTPPARRHGNLMRLRPGRRLPGDGQRRRRQACAMNVLYSLQHLGYTIPPQADAGWIGHGNQRSEWDAGCRFDFPTPNTADSPSLSAGGAPSAAFSKERADLSIDELGGLDAAGMADAGQHDQA